MNEHEATEFITRNFGADRIKELQNQFPGCKITEIDDEVIVELPPGRISGSFKLAPQRKTDEFKNKRPMPGIAALASLYADPTGLLSGSRKPRYSTAKKYNPCPCGSGLKFKFCCFKTP